MKQQTIILGPPGCGKTTHLLNLVDQEMSKGVHPARIGYFSFTKKATVEAMDRACAKFKMTRAELPFFRTFHSLAFQQLGLTKEQVMGPAAYRSIGQSLGLEFSDYMNFEEGVPTGSKTGDQCLWMVGMSRARMVDLREQWQEANSELDWFQLKQFNDTLVQYKETTGLLDFSDMLDRCMEVCPPLDLEVAVIDEAQDLSKQQWALALYMTMNAKRVYTAGDDDQAIYRWSGACVDSFLELEGERVVLNHSYRLPRTVYNLCWRIAERISRRIPKQWGPRDENGRVDYLTSLDNIKWRDGSYLILARNQYLLGPIEEFVKRAGIPYTTQRRSSVNTDHIKAIVLWERLRKGDSITGEEARSIYKYLRSGEGVSRGFKLLKAVPDDAQVNLAYLQENGGLLPPAIWHDALTAILPEDREFYLMAKRRGEKLTRKPRVHISTIHGVKGGEADHVVLLSDMAYRTYQDYQGNPDDEHRVAFVGARRARQTLSILMPQTNRAEDYR